MREAQAVPEVADAVLPADADVDPDDDDGEADDAGDLGRGGGIAVGADTRTSDDVTVARPLWNR